MKAGITEEVYQTTDINPKLFWLDGNFICLLNLFGPENILFS